MKALTLLKEVSCVPQPLLCPTVIDKLVGTGWREKVCFSLQVLLTVLYVEMQYCKVWVCFLK